MQLLRIHYLQHVPFEGLGYIKDWGEQNNHSLSSTKFYEDWKLPGFSDFDWLIVMGGPMSVNDYAEYPWLKKEKEFILKTIEAGKTVIGICLGSQLLASALGSKIYRNPKKEIGWFPLSKTIEAKQHRLLTNLPETFTSFHWHGDTFDLPKGAIHLLQTQSCKHQSFFYKERVLGIQFHLETTPATLQAMIQNCKHELIPEKFIQSEKEILQQVNLCSNSNQYLASILSKLPE